ncbi:DUF4190 domain-containing protein [Actinoallomurus sp. NBC_01490]|uniref:DUF4190 domain-containing protein n=1 Tax=Actinoallomurus sp. NBC_01490 TaxID=2903557 RepID=UPI002E30A390|nr:DUF4190 domain-containing protein [Actinoallomurus sp. NBC_01490]
MTYPPDSFHSEDVSAPEHNYGEQQAFGPGVPPQRPGPPLHRSSSDKVNGLAIGSLITGILGCVSFIGLILGIVALRQIKQRGGRGRGMAITGIVLFCVWTVIAVVGVIVSPDSGPTSASGGITTPKPTHTAPKKTEIQKMRVGQCINDAGTGAVDSLKVVPCDQPHDGEVMAIGTLHGLILPSEAQIRQKARTLCSQLAEKKIERDPAADVLTITDYYPTVEAWRGGDHGVTCLAEHVTEGRKLTRPIRS